MDVIVKQADAGVAAVFPVEIPCVEKAAEKAGVQLGRQRVFHAAPFRPQRVEAGDELQILPAQLLQGVIDFDRAFGAQAGDDTENVGVHPLFLQQSEIFGHPIPSGLSGGVRAQLLVDGLGAVHADAHEKAMGGEEVRPLLIEGETVGLDGVVHLHPLGVALRGLGHKMAEIIQPGQGRFAALKGKGDHPPLVQRGKGILDQPIGGSFGHPAGVGLGTIGCFVLVKAIPAAHIAQAGGGLDEKIQIFHGWGSPLCWFTFRLATSYSSSSNRT